MKHHFEPARLLLAALVAIGIAGVALAQAEKQPAEGAAAKPAGPSTAELTQKLDTVVGEQIAAQQDSQGSQRRVDAIDDETDRILAEYRKAQTEAESFSNYANQLAVQIQSQEDEIKIINDELAEIETTARDVLPLMQKMLATLKEFVRLDLPFLAEERAKRIASLEEMMGRADVAISEKYRRIIEAYQIEMEYGRTIEAYEGKESASDDARTVNFLRLGRVSLMYQTLDGRETGYWDMDNKTWRVDNDYRHAFAKGTSVAKKIGAPDLLHAPVPAPKES
jgi:chromosome segregation ATPase